MPRAAQRSARRAAAVGGNDDRRDDAVLRPQRGDHLEAVLPVVEVVVGDDHVGGDAEIGEEARAPRTGSPASRALAPQVLSRPTRAVRTAASFSITSATTPATSGGVPRAPSRRPAPAARRQGHADAEAGAAPLLGDELERVVERRAGPLDDGEAEAHPPAPWPRCGRRGTRGTPPRARRRGSPGRCPRPRSATGRADVADADAAPCRAGCSGPRSREGSEQFAGGRMGSLRTTRLRAPRAGRDPSARPASRNSSPRRVKRRRAGRWPGVSPAAPELSREMSRSAPRMLSTLSKALRARLTVSATSSGEEADSSAARKSFAALSGCSRSWLTAATKRDFEALARSAWASALCERQRCARVPAARGPRWRQEREPRLALGSDVGEADHEAPVRHLLAECVEPDAVAGPELQVGAAAHPSMRTQATRRAKAGASSGHQRGPQVLGEPGEAGADPQQPHRRHEQLPQPQRSSRRGGCRRRRWRCPGPTWSRVARISRACSSRSLSRSCRSSWISSVMSVCRIAVPLARACAARSPGSSGRRWSRR